MAALGLALFTISSPASSHPVPPVPIATGTARPGPRADAEAMAPPSGRWLGLE
jgi:hypothetical protein